MLKCRFLVVLGTLIQWIFKNDTTQIGSRTTRKLGTGTDVGSASIHATASLVAGDDVAIYVQIEATTDAMTAEDVTFAISK